MTDTNIPRVSVILPVHNAAPYLGAALDSVLGQTFEDFELLAHDDGSTDGSLAILQDYAVRDPRIKITSGSNQGIVATLNQLIETAQGDLLARMDADDICLPERFARQVAFFDGHPNHVMIGTATLTMDEADRIIAPNRPPQDHETVDGRHLRGLTSMEHPAVMMRTKAVRQLGGYHPGYPHAEDIDLWLRLAEVGRIGNMAEVLLQYRVHAQSVSARNQNAQLASCRRACEDAWARRGIEGTFEHTPWRMDDTRASRRDFFIKYGWDAWNWGYRDTWRHYALKSVRTDPLSLPAWKLLIFGALRRPTRKEIR